MRTSFEVHACSYSVITSCKKEKFFYKLIRVIQKVLIRNFSWFSAIHEIFLTLNYLESSIQFWCSPCKQCTYICSWHYQEFIFIIIIDEPLIDIMNLLHHLFLCRVATSNRYYVVNIMLSESMRSCIHSGHYYHIATRIKIKNLTRCAWLV